MLYGNDQVSQFNSESANWNMYFEACTWENIGQLIWIFGTSQNFVLDVLLFLELLLFLKSKVNIVSVSLVFVTQARKSIKKVTKKMSKANEKLYHVQSCNLHRVLFTFT